LPTLAQLKIYSAPGRAVSEGIESTAVLSDGTRRFALPTYLTGTCSRFAARRVAACVPGPETAAQRLIKVAQG
jgi:hypothetical protein